MTTDEGSDDDSPWYMRRSGAVLQSPAELDPTEESIVCPRCSALEWEVSATPQEEWECGECSYTWTPP